jgi:hypothetical protein
MLKSTSLSSFSNALQKSRHFGLSAADFRLNSSSFDTEKEAEGKVARKRE